MDEADLVRRAIGDRPGGVRALDDHADAMARGHRLVLRGEACLRADRLEGRDRLRAGQPVAVPQVGEAARDRRDRAVGRHVDERGVDLAVVLAVDQAHVEQRAAREAHRRGQRRGLVVQPRRLGGRVAHRGFLGVAVGVGVGGVGRPDAVGQHAVPVRRAPQGERRACHKPAKRILGLPGSKTTSMPPVFSFL